MTAMPAPDLPPAPGALTPEDLLALVRRSSQQFQRRDPAIPETQAESSFAPQTVVRPLRTPAPEAEPAPVTATPEEKPTASFTPAPPPATFDIEAERRVAWAEGHAAALQDIEAARAAARAEALEEARATAAQDIAETRDAFTAAITRLTSAENERLADLSTKLELAVRQLATQRAGQKIDEAPRPFLRRIEKITHQIAAGAENTVVLMNPADLMAIKPHIKDFSPLAKGRLSPDTTLGRGDLRIRMEDITFSDVIAERDGGLA
ncbi:FliH/SctL family protein [Roseovarius mucosus]|uniref:FliH/SctL family protein n=2 Tax=Roseovarius mucosus TaxID=215743 RepID=UPI0035CF35F3